MSSAPNTVPPPDGGIITDAQQDAAVSVEVGLPHWASALWVRQDGAPASRRIVHVDIPDIGLAHLVT